MSSPSERRVKALIILLTLLVHALIIYIFFILARKDSYEPLHITAKPQVIEYLLNSLSQQQNNLITKALPPALAAATKQLAKSQIQELDEDGFDQYMVKNAISYGSYNQGSIVSMEQEGVGDNNPKKDSKPDTQPSEPQKQEPTPELEQTNLPNKTDNQEPEKAEPADQAIQADTQKNEQEETTVDSTTGMTPALAQAEEILNDTGSSWITKSQTPELTKKQSPAQAQQQPHPQPHASTYQNYPAKKLTLADITRGYIKQVRHEQDSTGHCSYKQGVTGSGSTGSVRYGVNAPPTDGAALSEQIYASKLYNLLEQSAQAYSNQIYSCRDLEMETMIEVTIEKSGKILNVALKPNLPEKDMEQALCLIVTRVGLFPPIPRQFHKQRIVLSIPIRIKSQQGFASYRLLYGLRSA